MKTAAALAVLVTAVMPLAPAATAADAAPTVDQQLWDGLKGDSGQAKPNAAQQAVLDHMPAKVKTALLHAKQGSTTTEDRNLILANQTYKDLANTLAPLKHTVTSGETTEPQGAAYSLAASYPNACKTADPYITAYDFTGQAILYRWHLYMSVCYSGNKINRIQGFYHHITNWDKIWKDRGLKAESKPTTGGSSTMGYARGHMEQCPPIWPCSSEHYPAMNIKITATGGVSVYNAHNN